MRSIVLAAMVLLTPARAEAHLGHVILRAERYLKLDVSGNDARVVVSLTLGDSEGARVLEAADEDGDGNVTEAERDAYLATWSEGLASELPITVDGERVPVVWGEPFMEPIGRVASVAVTVEMVAHVALDGGRQRLRIEDRMVRREVYERTDVAFRARDRAELRASIVGEDEPSEVTPDAMYDGTFMRGRPVPLVAIVETPERPSSWTHLAIPGALLALAIGVLILFRVRRKKRVTGGTGSSR